MLVLTLLSKMRRSFGFCLETSGSFFVILVVLAALSGTFIDKPKVSSWRKAAHYSILREIIQ